MGVLCKISKKNKAPKSIAKCKFYGLKYLCDSKTRDISNLFFHLPKYMKPPSTLNDPKQTTIDLRPGDVSGLICTSTRFNFEACRRAIAMFVNNPIGWLRVKALSFFIDNYNLNLMSHQDIQWLKIVLRYKLMRKLE